MASNKQLTSQHTQCPDCGADMVKTSNNDPLVMDRTKYKCTDCGNEHTVYEQ